MYRIGWATRAAALHARRQLLAIAAREFFEGSEPSDLDIVDGVIRRARPAGSNVQVTISQALNTFRSDTLGQTSSITGRPDVPMPPATAFARHFAAHFAEVEVDIETGEIKLLDYLATQDSGTVVNPQVLKNQAIGGAICGAGFAIYEHLAFDPATGAIKNASLLDYKLLRAADFPHPAMVLFADSYDPVGPFGEAPIAAAISAVSQAVYDAIGVRVDLPMTPERVVRALGRIWDRSQRMKRVSAGHGYEKGRLNAHATRRLHFHPSGLPRVTAPDLAQPLRLGRRVLVGFACLFVRT